MKDKENEKYKNEIAKITSFFMAYRKENNLTQYELAEKIGRSQQAISRLEKNCNNPSLGFLINALGKIGYKITIEKIS